MNVCTECCRHRPPRPAPNDDDDVCDFREKWLNQCNGSFMPGNQWLTEHALLPPENDVTSCFRLATNRDIMSILLCNDFSLTIGQIFEMLIDLDILSHLWANLKHTRVLLLTPTETYAPSLAVFELFSWSKNVSFHPPARTGYDYMLRCRG